MTAATDAPARHRPPRARRRGYADGGPAAADRAAPQRDAVDPAGDRRAVLVRLLPVRQGHAAVLGAAHVLEHGAGTRHHGFRAVRGRRGRLDRVAGRQAPHRRPGGRRRPAALGGPARHLGRGRDLGGGRLPGLRGRHVRRLRPPGPAGLAAVVVGGGRRRGRDCVQRRGVRGRRLLPQPVRRAGGRVRRLPGGDRVVDRTGSATPAGGR